MPEMVASLSENVVFGSWADAGEAGSVVPVARTARAANGGSIRRRSRVDRDIFPLRDGAWSSVVKAPAADASLAGAERGYGAGRLAMLQHCKRPITKIVTKTSICS